MEPTHPDCRKVSKEKKDLLWKELKKCFQFPHGTNDKVKAYALKQMGIAYRKWKTILNTKYLKNDLTPFAEFGKITEAQWEEFKRQRTTVEAIELSRANSALAKRDVHKPRLGPGGEDLIAKGLADPYEGLNDRTFLWVRGKHETEEVVKQIKLWAEKEKEGTFVSDRENDCLTQGLGTPEHGGRVRGISSKKNWKHGFTQDVHRYKRHDHFKEQIRQTANQADVPGGPSILGRIQIPASFQVDNIESPCPCELHIPLGIHGRTEEVAKAIPYPGSNLFRGTTIPPDYARVSVLSVENKHKEEMIDIPTPKGIKYIGDSVKEFILWNKKYILNLTPQQQLECAEQGQSALANIRQEEECVVHAPEETSAPPDVNVHEDDATEKSAQAADVSDRPATPPGMVSSVRSLRKKRTKPKGKSSQRERQRQRTCQ
ncbi:hypothetical protein BS78_05G285700 [Paspalum vaginatum]|nr:hypothetical protein BS78_05G285700 [Paspalum vaginatum]